MPRRSTHLRSASLGALSLAVFTASACTPNPHERLNSPPQGDSDRPHRMQEHFAYMGDNAMLQDMSMLDLHYVPHQARLSGTGQARLERYVELLADSGGMLHYYPPNDDPDLTKARLEFTRKFLADACLPNHKIEIEVGLNRGPDTDAKYAIEARHMGTTVPEPKDSTAAPGTPGGSSSGGSKSGTSGTGGSTGTSGTGAGGG